jgi:hypothetical protein
MNEKKFYITDRDSWGKHIHSFHPQHGSHYIDLPNGKIFAGITWHDEAAQVAFELHADGGGNPLVETLPHPVHEGTKKLKQKHLDMLADLNPGQNDTIIDLVRKAGQRHPRFRLSAIY